MTVFGCLYAFLTIVRCVFNHFQALGRILERYSVSQNNCTPISTNVGCFPVLTSISNYYYSFLIASTHTEQLQVLSDCSQLFSVTTAHISQIRPQTNCFQPTEQSYFRFFKPFSTVLDAFGPLICASNCLCAPEIIIQPLPRFFFFFFEHHSCFFGCF